MLQVGSVLDGKYKILNEIGHGGMSVVYLALNERANKTWAIKEVRKDGGNDQEVVSQGLIAETEMLKKLHHPNLPSIVDVIDTNDSFIIVMDYIEGRSLQDLLDTSGPQPVDLVVDWAKQLCDVLGYLHSRIPPIIYRDMKPPNVMLRPNGQVMLIDFGTAREYKQHNDRDTTWLGTRGYAAPEQFGGRGQTDGRTDIYCLGATIYHLLTGYSPADTQFVILPLGQLRPELAGSGIEEVVATCCQPDPANRYQNCAELMYALDHIHDLDYATKKKRARRWRLFIASIALAVAGAGGMGGFHIAESNTRKASYDSYIRSAENSTELGDKIEYYRKAIDRQPSREDAYDSLLTYIEGDRIFTADEKKALESCLNKNGEISKNSTNIDYFRSKNRAGYDNFEFRLGKDYFSYLGNGKTDANRCFKEVIDSNNLSEQDLKIANSLFKLTDYYAQLGKTNQDWAQGTGKYNYKDFWTMLQEMTADPNTIDEKTGDVPYSVAMYREVATQISSNMRQFRNAGVNAQQMKDIITAAKVYLSGIDKNQYINLFDTLIPQTNNAIEDAENAISAAFGGTIKDTNTNKETDTNTNTDTNANTAPADEKQ